MAESSSLTIAGQALPSRLIIGTSRYPSLSTLGKCVGAAEPGLLTVAIRRSKGEGNDFYHLLSKFNIRLLPNTAGCRNAHEACTIARLARELLDTNWIKLEVIADEETQTPDPFELLTAAEKLLAEDFVVLAYCTDDLVLCQRLADAGCHAVMPWGAPIGSGQGLTAPDRLAIVRECLADTILIVDAGIGRPSDATQAMELGYDGVLINTAIATAGDPVSMASAFASSVKAGKEAYDAGIMPRHATARPSSPQLAVDFTLPRR